MCNSRLTLFPGCGVALNNKRTRLPEGQKINTLLVIVTHDARIFGFADRIAQMDDGHVLRVVESAAELH
jgi:ABC-type siderophore export system fused ATPase/permease subunit